ncbi:unnamed protein product [Mytilus coruscus]|uniref:Death ligand signal enhancer n=1 Tax=Mytilus coruscus TaxID=42192 RepID=A0A6J8E2E3_MYTCO|nr:unnamed protein product [Mytilus coruscus]
MWRWLNGLPRAIRQHFHGPRASATGVCREDEAEFEQQCKDLRKKKCIFVKDHLGICTFRYKGEDRYKHGPDQDKWYKNYNKDFHSFFNGNHNALEALGWGAAVVLGIHLSKCPIHQPEKHKPRKPPDGQKHCMLWQVTTASNLSPEHDEDETTDPLYKVMNEFEDMCKKYTGIGKNIQGLQEATKSQMKKAASKWIDASHLGYTKAQFNIGLCYETGKGVKQNLRKAEKYYKLAAEDGHQQALYNLALLYLKGEGCIEKNVNLAIELLQKAAEYGLGQAQTYLGVYYTEEETQDLEKAVSLFQAAADQNESTFNFGKITQKILTLFSDEEYKGEDRYKHGPDQDKWYKNYNKDFHSFFNGNHNALEALGWGAAVVLGIHLSKCPIHQPEKHKPRKPPDGQKHCMLWQVALAIPDKVRPHRITSHSIVDSDVSISSRPLIGNSDIKFDSQKQEEVKDAASKWIDASHLGYTKAQFNIGLCYETGKGVKQNLRKAEKYYKLAAEDGHQQALYNLALLYLKGEGCIEKNVNLAIELLQKAAEYGLGQAQTYLGVYYTEEETQDLEKAVSLFQAAADQNDPEAQYFLGVCYENGWGVEVNECKSAELYSQAASSGHDGALYSLGVFYELAIGGLPEDKARAIELFKKATDRGNEQARAHLEKIQADADRKDLHLLNIEKDENKRTVIYLNDEETEIQEEEEKKSIKLNVSMSSPSLHRLHPTSPQFIFISHCPIHQNHISSIISSASKGEITANSELSPLLPVEWNPLYGSPRRSEGHDRVSFSIGADEEDLDGLLDLENDSLPNEPTQIHHFCSFIQKTSTMPNLQSVSCN